jgi:hypothetical protein
MHPETVTFAARWDNRLRISTPLISALVVSVVLILPGQPWTWLAKGVLVVMLAGIWAWAPKSYRVEQDDLIVKRLAGEVRIPLAGLRNARIMRPDETRGAVRIWAVGGCFGYFGRFLNGLETQTWYVTDTRKCVRLDCVPDTVVISPSDPPAFLSALPVSHEKA